MTQYCNENFSMSILLPAVGLQETVDYVIIHRGISGIGQREH